jgi:hypothetical protein
MARTIYEKSTRLLLKDMLDEWKLQPGQVFTSSRVLEWFAKTYPKLSPVSLRAHLVQASTNDRSRLHHPSTNGTDDLLFKVGPGQFRLYEIGKDPAPIHEMVQGDVAREEVAQAQVQAEEYAEAGEAAVGSSEFLLEQDLQRYLAENLDCVEPGLTLYEEDGVKGLEFDAGGRRIDILARDRQGDLVVIELKVSKGYDRVVGQLLRYVNWVRREVAMNGQKVRGMIIYRAMTEDLRLACAGINGIELMEYTLSVTVKKVPALD